MKLTYAKAVAKLDKLEEDWKNKAGSERMMQRINDARAALEAEQVSVGKSKTKMQSGGHVGPGIPYAPKKKTVWDVSDRIDRMLANPFGIPPKETPFRYPSTQGREILGDIGNNVWGVTPQRTVPATNTPAAAPQVKSPAAKNTKATSQPVRYPGAAPNPMSPLAPVSFASGALPSSGLNAVSSVGSGAIPNPAEMGQRSRFDFSKISPDAMNILKYLGGNMAINQLQTNRTPYLSRYIQNNYVDRRGEELVRNNENFVTAVKGLSGPGGTRNANKQALYAAKLKSDSGINNRFNQMRDAAAASTDRINASIDARNTAILNETASENQANENYRTRQKLNNLNALFAGIQGNQLQRDLLKRDKDAMALISERFKTSGVDKRTIDSLLASGSISPQLAEILKEIAK